MQQKALRRVIGHNLLTFNAANDNNTPDTTTLNVIHLIDTWLAKKPEATDTITHDAISRLKLEKVFAYRHTGFYAEALEILNAVPFQSSARMIERWNYWFCTMSVENEFFKGNIGEQELTDGIATCRSMYAPMIMPYAGEMSNSNAVQLEKIKMKLYPVPTENWLYLELSDIEITGNYLMKVYTSTGQMLQMENRFVGTGRGGIQVSNLKPGVYVFELHLDNEVLRQKFIKE